MESGSARRATPPQRATNAMRTAKAAVCEAPNTPFVIKEYPLRPGRPQHLIPALDFVRSNRQRVPFHQIVDSRFSLPELDLAFKKASEHSVLRAAIVP
jgi:hypothetical protein